MTLPRALALVLALSISWVAPAMAQTGDAPQPTPLWPQGAPGAEGNSPGEDKFHSGDVPTLTAYPAPKDKATGASVVVCPGGAYGFLAVEHEGEEVAKWLNSLGVSAFVLKYRLAPKYHHPAPLQDAQRAIRTVRAKSKEWGLDPHRIGIIGFSAGGHLASSAATHFDAGDPNAADPIDRESCRPDRAILVYPVIALSTPYGHTGSLKNLLGDHPTEEQVKQLSSELQVTKDTPPTFLAHTNADSGVVPENSILFALACRKAGVPVELHLFEKGVHGLGLGTGWADRIKPEPSFAAWPTLCATWLKGQGFLDRTQP